MFLDWKGWIQNIYNALFVCYLPGMVTFCPSESNSLVISIGVQSNMLKQILTTVVYKQVNVM